MQRLFEIIYEDKEILVINKPAGLVCHPTKTDAYSSLISRVRIYLKRGTPGWNEPDLHATPATAPVPGGDRQPRLVNRLDRETSGVTLVAKGSEVARELGRIWETRRVAKEYLAVVHGRVRAERGLIRAPLGKDEQSRVAIKDCVRPDGADAATEFEVVKRFTRRTAAKRLGSTPAESQVVQPGEGSRDRPGPASAFTLLRVLPRTGRKHQIRLHLAHIGHPVVGDKLYGGDEDLYLALVEGRLTAQQRERLILPFHALHAAGVRFTWRGQERTFRAEPEPWFSEFAAGD